MTHVEHGYESFEALTAELEALSQRIERGRRSSADPGLAETLLADLETAHEELRVATEELMVQQAELDRMVVNQRLGDWQHERLLSVLPVPVVVTDATGSITSVNTATARLLNMPVDRIIRKPLQSFVALPERTTVRQLLSRAKSEGAEIDTTVRLVPRHRPEVTAQLIATAGDQTLPGHTDVTWVMWAAPHAGPDAALSLGDLGAAARALVELTLLPLHREDEVPVLQQAADICAVAMGAETAVTVTVGAPVDPSYLASSDRRAQHIDGAQVISGEGPCQSAWDTGTTIVSPDLLSDERWPNLTRHLDAGSAGAVVAVPLRVGDDRLGVLNVYQRASAVGEPVEEATLSQGRLVEVAELLAAAVAAILHEVDAKASLERLAEQMQTAMEFRAPIEQAKGIIMAARKCGPDQAFELLVAMSNRENVKLREVARQLVDRQTR